MAKVKKVETLPEFFNDVRPGNLYLVSKPFSARGEHKISITILSFFLDKKPKKKLDILLDGGILKDATDINTGSYGTKYFSSLCHTKAIKYNTLTQTWERGENFLGYLEYALGYMMKTKAKDKILELLSDEQALKAESDLGSVVVEMLADRATVNTLRRIWRGTESCAENFIINADDYV